MTNYSRSDLLIITAIAVAVFMDGLDGSIANVALPSIARDFGTDTGTIAWATILYFMMVAGLMLPFGRVADSNRLKRVFVIGFSVFTVGSLACGLSPSAGALFASRAVQGIGAAAMGSSGPMMCVKLLPMDRLPTSLTVVTLSVAVASACGPAVGGFLTEYLSWHWAFLINVPIGVFAVAFGLKVIPGDGPRTEMHVDVPGAATLFAAVACGVLALETCSAPGAETVCAASAAACALLLAAFVLVELRARVPILNVRIFRRWKLDSVLVSLLLIHVIYMGMLYLLPFYMSVAIGLGSGQSGLILLIPSVVVILICIPVGKACERRGARPFAVASSLLVLAYCSALALIRPGMGVAPLLAIGVMMGAVWGLCGASCGTRVVAHTPDEDKAMGSAVMNFTSFIGATVGTALFASLMAIGSGSGGVPVGELSPEVFAAGFTFAAVVAVVLALASVLTGWIVRKDP